ncbi:MAG: hypothetical protein JNL63_05045 [Bacteroidia bacterium]|nr:hypothetical protein [Bacteroidia bacterium]
MKKPDDLFLLIHSMTGPEKRYFKLFSALYDRDKNYLKLFDHIAKQKGGDGGKELANKFKKEKWVKSLSNTKYELYNAILNSLEVYHKRDTVDSMLASYMNQLNLLHDKRLFRAAKKLIDKIEKLALKHEKHHYLLMVNSVRVIIMTKLMNVKEIARYIDNGAYEKEQYYLKCLENNSDFLNINLKLSKASELFVRTNEAKELQELSSSELLKSPDRALTFYARRNYYYINYLCRSRLGKLDETAYLQQKEWIDYLESEKDMLVSRAGIYLSGIIRFIATINSTKLKTGLEPIFIKAKSFYHNLPVKMKTDDLKSTFMGVTGNYMEGQIALLKPHKAIEAWESIRHLIPYESLGGESKMVTSANLAYAHFLMEEYRTANKYLNNILNYTEDARPDIQAYARIFTLFINYEMGNSDSIISICLSSKNYLLKYKLLGKYESRLIRFFQKDIFGAPENSKQSILFEQLKVDLAKLMSDSKTPAARGFDIVSWLDSKVEKRLFMEILKEKSTVVN